MTKRGKDETEIKDEEKGLHLLMSHNSQKIVRDFEMGRISSDHSVQTSVRLYKFKTCNACQNLLKVEMFHKESFMLQRSLVIFQSTKSIYQLNIIHETIG